MILSSTDDDLDPALLSEFHKALMNWYASHKRDLPWRNTGDPYAVWISEMMLQQTRVVQAQPYFTRFMTRFPTVRHLAEADLQQVLKVWEGLGYYARARNLSKAARQIVEEFGGRLPDRIDDLSRLPGIGPYSAAAMLSIAFGQDHAAVDGNVVRVLTRLFAIAEPPDIPRIRRRITRLADRLLCRGRAADFNQAMMELGATVCTPRRPSCGVCPVTAFCAAHAELDDPARLPARRPRRPRPHYTMTAGIITREPRILIVQRPIDGLLGGLWEFPGGRRQDGEALKDGLAREIRAAFGIGINGIQSLATIKHAFTHFEITLYGFTCDWADGEVTARSGAVWVTREELAGYAFSKAHNRLIDAWRLAQSSVQLPLL